jgi:rod shape-determining protein MreD
MKRRALLLATILLGALLQQLLPAWPLFGGIKPPVLGALALHYALRKGRSDMWLAVFAAAILHDGLELGSFGPALLSFPVFGLLANKVRNEVFADGLVTQFFFGGMMAVFITFVTMLVYAVTGQRPLPAGMVLLRLLGSLCLGVMTLPLVSLAINRLEAMIPKPRGYGWQ